MKFKNILVGSVLSLSFVANSTPCVDAVITHCAPWDDYGFISEEQEILNTVSRHISGMEKNPALIFAAGFGCSTVVNRLIINGADIDYADSNGNTALIKAAMNGCTDVVRALLSHHANVSITNHDQKTALSLAKNNEIKTLIEDYINEKRFKTTKSARF